jgi:hypothetical protein
LDEEEDNQGTVYVSALKFSHEHILLKILLDPPC